MVLSAQDDLDTLRQAAEQGDAEAQFVLGSRYANGEGVLKDEAEAVRWYRLAAEQGHTVAQLALGLMYANGEGVLKDEAEAVRWYRLAAESGEAITQYVLGQMYVLEQGARKDFGLAHMWLNIASANGEEGAGELRDTFVEDNMTRDEISRAIELARTCMTSDSKTANRKRR